jgi:hypothetical protein
MKVLRNIQLNKKCFNYFAIKYNFKFFCKGRIEENLVKPKSESKTLTVLEMKNQIQNKEMDRSALTDFKVNENHDKIGEEINKVGIF